MTKAGAPSDYSSRVHTEKLCRMIRDYWSDTDQRPKLKVTRVGEEWVISSDMVNGLPPKKKLPPDRHPDVLYTDYAPMIRER